MTYHAPVTLIKTNKYTVYSKIDDLDGEPAMESCRTIPLHPLHHHQRNFPIPCAISPSKIATDSAIVPKISLLEILRGSKTAVDQLFAALIHRGYFLLTYGALGDASSPSSSAALVLEAIVATVEGMKSTLTPNTANWPPSQCSVSSGDVYFNERDVPMYRLGYDDGTGGESGDKDKIREYFRVANGNIPGVGGWREWGREVVRGTCFCSYLADVLLHHTLGPKRRKPKRSHMSRWMNPESIDLEEPSLGGVKGGDFSILYAMNYFNTLSSISHASSPSFTGSDGRPLSLREHVDPSLFVIEPVVGRGVGGLEIWDKLGERWVAADGEGAEAINCLEEGEDCMAVFVGKAFERAWKSEKPNEPAIHATLHRVRQPVEMEVGTPRRAVIYEQKYAEYFA
ncbi:hypothetical protein TrCOL_g2327 [Triparma columacea]|uniref:Uncharacterized protein n=1 Tax=Triparma columacea TaxID=722753 RepID=A0A9W7G4S4_9STRA|nr:hypothetical protein TrCOL_g2327 [Triparma columacea]